MEFGDVNIPNSFWIRCKIDYSRIYENTPCWEWIGSIACKGYGLNPEKIKYGMYSYKGKSNPAYRWIKL